MLLDRSDRTAEFTNWWKKCGPPSGLTLYMELVSQLCGDDYVMPTEPERRVEGSFKNTNDCAFSIVNNIIKVNF
ncbi:hypothetical protein KJ641_03110 [Patescibacteria group bacterium]|nr:hypothetical protein [Patescibacteria group bacterium]MBU1895832.1 hypothetical protein [Patescibacteria group bacterium]